MLQNGGFEEKREERGLTRKQFMRFYAAMELRNWLRQGLLWGWMILPAATLVYGEAGWELVWSDEFEVAGKPDEEKWTYDLGGGGWGNAERQVYTDSLENARVEDGVLKIVAMQEDGDTRTPGYTSARLTTRGIHSQQYGRVEVRAKVPSETGTWSAIWLLSEDGIFSADYWPDNGEIDIMEHVGYEEDPLYLASRGEEWVPNIHSTLHTLERNHLVGQGIGDSVYVPDASTAFHTYVLEWDAEKIVTYVDGVEILRVEKATDAGIPLRNPPEELWPYWPFDQEFHLLLNVAIGGQWGGAFRPEFNDASPYGSNGIDHDGEWPQVMEVDYVRFYERAEAASEWRGYPVSESGWANTGEWMGMLYVAEEPYIYVPELEAWVWMSPATGTGSGAWLYRFH